MLQYFENEKRYVHIYYWWLIGSCIWALDWHRDRKFELIAIQGHRRISRDSLMSVPPSLKRMKIDQYCQQQRWNPLNKLFNIKDQKLWVVIQHQLSLAHTGWKSTKVTKQVKKWWNSKWQRYSRRISLKHEACQTVWQKVPVTCTINESFAFSHWSSEVHRYFQSKN